MAISSQVDQFLQHLTAKLEALGDPVEDVTCESIARLQDFDYDVRCKVTYIEPSGRREALFCSRTISELHITIMEDIYDRLVAALWDKIADFDHPNTAGLADTSGQVFSDDVYGWDQVEKKGSFLGDWSP